MGKRRTEAQHRSRYDEEDDDDDVIEEIPAPEPVSEEMRATIQGRKKLVAKRRVNESNAGQASIFSGATTITTTNDDSSNKPSIFSGFKGFGGFSAAPPTSTSSSSISIEKAAPTPSLFNPEPFKPTNPPLSTTTNTAISFSFLENKPPVLSSSTSSTNGATTLKESNGATNTELNSGAKTTSDTKTANSGKNLTEAELKFIYGLNELYESCYGHGDRSYKLPDSVINGDSGGSGNDDASKYAYMLSALNKHCAKWISKHVEESPLVILTPVFIDYFNYLIQLEKKFFPETFKNPNNKPTVQLSATMNGHNEKENKEVKPAPFQPAQLTPISIFSGSSTLTAPAAAVAPPTLPPTNTTATSTLNVTPSVTPTLTFGSGTKPPPSSFSSFSFTPLTTLKDTTAEKTQEEPTKKNESEKPLISLPITKTPVISFDKTETPAAKPNPFTDLTTASKSIFQFGSGASSTNNTPSLTPFGSFSTPKPAEESSSSEKTLTATPASSATPFNFLSNLNKDKPVSETTTEKPAQTPTPAATSTPFFSFGSQANKPSIFSGIGASGDAAAKPATSIFGSLGSTSSPFGAASTGGLLFGAGSTGTPFGAAAGNIGGSGETGEDGEEEAYEPPKPETSDVKEEGSVLTKRIKLFYYNEKESKFTDRGIGNLFIKPTNDGESTQLVVRADNKLANILLNVKLSKALPVGKAGAKDVSYLCLPNPPIPNVESNVPCKFLFRVKTEEDAQELLDKLNEYKK